MTDRFRGVRTRLLLAVLAAVTVALVTAATIGFNLLLVRTNADDADSLLRQRASAERSQIAIDRREAAPRRRRRCADRRQPHLALRRHTRHRAATLPALATSAAARALASGPGRFVTVKATDERLFALPVTAGGRRVGTIVAGLSLSPYEQTERSALLASLAFAATLLLVSWGAARWLLRAALEPVAEMTTLAATWSETRPRPALRAAASRTTSSRGSRSPSTGCSTGSPRACVTSGGSRPSSRTSSARRSPRSPPRPSSRSGGLASPRNTVGALGVILTNADQIARIVDTLFAAARAEAGPRGVADADRRRRVGDRVVRGARRGAEPRARRRRRARPAHRRRPRSGRANPAPGARQRLPVRATQRPALDRPRQRERLVHRRRRRPRRRLRRGSRRSSSRPPAAPRVSAPGRPPGSVSRLARRLARSVLGRRRGRAVDAGGRFVVRLPSA